MNVIVATASFSVNLLLYKFSSNRPTVTTGHTEKKLQSGEIHVSEP